MARIQRKHEITSGSEDVRNRNPCTLLMDIWNGVATVETSLVISQEVKHRIRVWPSILFVGVYPKELGEKKYSNKNLYTKICP